MKATPSQAAQSPVANARNDRRYSFNIRGVTYVGKYSGEVETKSGIKYYLQFDGGKIGAYPAKKLAATSLASTKAP